MTDDQTPSDDKVAKQQVVAYTQKSQIKHENRHIQLVREYGFHPRTKATVEDGDVLPRKFEPFPENMYGKPLEEIDNFIYEETFCVVSKRFRKNYIHRFTGTKSLFLFHPWSRGRRVCVYIATNQYFDYCVMATILFNCIFLARTETSEEAEYIFLAIYSLEMFIKIIAKGFLLNKYTYLRNPWNWLDFIVITSGYATIGMEVGNLAGLRTFRVLRALKTVSIMPGLKTIINALLHSFRQLAEVMTLTIFCLMVFALFALQVYMGELRNKCVKNLPDDWVNLTSAEWKSWVNDTENWLYDLEELPMLCGNLTGARHCPTGYTCLCVGENPNHGYTNFDNFMWSMLTTFQLITLDYWENVYNMVLATSGPMSVSFFTVVVFFGSFYLINLMLAVVALSYEEEAEITNEERKKDLLDHREDSTFSFDPSILNVKKLNKNYKKKIDSRKGVLLAQYSKKKTRRKKKGKDGAPNENGNGQSQSRSVTPSPSPSPRHSTDRPQALNIPNQRPRGISFQDEQNKNPNMLYPSDYKGQLLPGSRQASSNASEGGGVNRESSLDDSGVVDDHEEQDTGNEMVNTSAVELQSDLTPVTLALSPREVRLIKCNGNIARIKKHNIYALHQEFSSEIVVIDDLPDRNCDRCVQCCVDYEGWLQFQNCLYKIVRDPLFELAITLCIVLNTMFLAMEHHGMSESFRQALDIGNKVFTSIFTFECIVKLLALSKEFFLCGWNIFDLIIVTASLLDIIFELVDGLSVLRGLRLLRVLKLAQSWTTMKVLLSIIISTIGALGNLTLILVIVIYIFAVIGMQLFSKDYTPEKFDPDPVPRWNFNDFFHSFMMIFRILCGEWIEPLWDCMRAEEEQGASTCFAIFLPTLVMGNFMVLNLFLALLLNSFNSEELKSKKEEVGEESKLARSIERVRDLIRRKRQARKEKKELKYATKFEQVVREAQVASVKQTESETKFHRLSYQESMNRPVSGSDFGFQIPLREGLHTIIDGGEYEEEYKEGDENICLNDDNNQKNDYTLYPHVERKLLHQVSSGFGTQQNDSRDEPTFTESIELRLMGQYNSTDTDPGDQQSVIFQRADSLRQHDEAYLQYQKSLLTRSPSYRKSLDRLSQSSETSQRSLIPSRSKSEDENIQNYDRMTIKRVSSGHSLNTISIEQDDYMHQGNLRDELLNCDQKELFQFLQDDVDNSNNYFSETVGYGSAVIETETDSLILDAKKDASIFSPPRKTSSSSLKSNLSYISNSILHQIEQRRNGSICESIDKVFGRSESQGIFNGSANGDDSHDQLPLVGNSEFDNIIQSFEKELEEIKKSTTSLERRLSNLSEPSPAADECNKDILDHIAAIEADHANYEVAFVQRRHHPNSHVDRNSVKIKRRSLEKQRKIDEDFSISNEIRKICDQMHAPFAEVGSTSPFLRRKNDLFSAQFDRFKRLSLIERVDELPEDEKFAIRIESEKLPRKCLTADLKIDSLSLKSTNSYENLLIQKQRNQLQSEIIEQQQHQQTQRVVPPTPPQSLKSITPQKKMKTPHPKAGDFKMEGFKVHPQPFDKTTSISLSNQCDYTSGANEEDKPTTMTGQKSTFTRLTEKPWHCLVSYVDDLTVGGRRNSQGAYNDPMSFPSFGTVKPPKVPQDCFPQKCYDHLFFRCPCFMSCMDTKWAKNWTQVRTAVLTVVDTPAFEWFVLVLIFASSITLCFEDIYLDNNKTLKRILYWTNFSFCIIFVIEMVLKWLALGFSKYFTSFWTILDFIIVFVSVFSLLIEENENLKVLRSLRTLRALRPLRAISRWQGMRIVVNALMYAIPSIFNVLLVCLVFWLIFSIMGVQFFGGKFFKCIDDDGELLPITEVNDKWDCIEQNYSWINSKITFDHVGMGYLALLQVATFEGWMEVMADAVDARGIDLQPQREANLYAYIYFVIFIVCGSFFTLNLFIGVIIDNFNMLKKKYEGGVLEMFLTESQKHYYTAMKKLGRKKPQKVIKRPFNHFLAMFYDLSNSRRFEIAIFVLIFLNMLTMGIEHYNQPHAVFFILEVSNAFFTTVFGLEAIVKIIGLRYHYFTVPWNVFDFLLVLASIFGILMEDIMIDLPISPTLLRVVRVFRIGRILRLIKAAKGIRKLLFALVVSLPALFNIGALLGLITFIYAILGMSLFGHVKLQGALDDMVNFQTFGRSMQLLFRLMTSAGWNDVLESLMIQPPDCDPYFNRQTNGDCGHPLLAITYFTSFIIISYMIVINMYIAIILENFNQAHQEEEIGIVEDDLEMFYIRWSKYDPHATQFIHFSQLSDFIASLDPPLGISKPNTVALVSFNLPISKGNKIHCLDILHALVKHVLGHVEETDNFKQLQEQMDVKFKKQFPTRKELEIVSSTRIWKRQEKAAKLIQTTWKEYQRVKKEKERSVNSGDDDGTQSSSPGGWHAKLSALNFFHLQVSRRGTQCSSRASSRKSSRASDASDLSELAGPWLNLPLMLVSGADDVMKDIKQQNDDIGKRGSIFVEAPRANRRRSFYNFFLRHQDAVDDSLTSPSVHRKSITPTTTDEKTIIAPTPTRKRATSFIRKKPPLERGLSAQSALRVNKNAFVSDGPSEVSILVTKPSPEAPTGPSLRPDNSTLVHVLVHRESEEYKTETDDEEFTPIDKIHRAPQIKISPGSDDFSSDDMGPYSGVQINVESPKDPPQGDFTSQLTSALEMYPPQPTESSSSRSIINDDVIIDVSEPIDVNIQGDTSQIFYDYKEETDDQQQDISSPSSDKDFNETIKRQSPQGDEILILEDNDNEQFDSSNR
ncbi:sodium channel protein 60E isoform X2 [Episyrphus balteatus]|uniref:sodium channel protein 60E isoform X2 n=1 Tax=Episyrphus balteatus TaxID=286459 RepID=UPI00248618E0|nr:sodium channel protein 60E isoform X2 [Episyrphus balteatus]